MDSDVVDVVVEGALLRISFNRPAKLNALTDEVLNLTAEALRTADPKIRAAVITGRGRAFSAGADISAPDPEMRRHRAAISVVSEIVKAPFPIVAAVNGVAVGVGCSIALASDFVVAKESASFMLPFTKLGIMPDGGASQLLAASIGRARAMELTMTAAQFTAADALAWGLVTRVVPDVEFEASVEALLGSLREGPTLAYAATKAAVNTASIPGFLEALNQELQAQAVLGGSLDHAEGIRAFGVGEQPGFLGK
jgi:enoyl-CoA hydratase